MSYKDKIRQIFDEIDKFSSEMKSCDEQELLEKRKKKKKKRKKSFKSSYPRWISGGYGYIHNIDDIINGNDSSGVESGGDGGSGGE